MRVRGTVAYDGAPFHGFAVNDGVPTVAGLLSGALSRVLGAAVVLTCAGRTDRGVHAVGQVVSFDAPDDASLNDVRRAVNRQCRPSVVVTALERAADDFDARFSASGRTYRYRILDRPDPDPFTAQRAWHVWEPLDIEAMQLATTDLVGEHDFSSFCRRPIPRPDGTPADLVRRVTAASWRRVADGLSGADLLEFEVSATAFCHQMVRSLVGTLVAVGRGQIAADSMPSVLDARDRQVAGDPAPPEGLTFWSVDYPKSTFEPAGDDATTQLANSETGC